MKFIMMQPEISRFEWELEVVITNLLELNESEIFLVFSSFDLEISNKLKSKYPSINIFRYDDNRKDKSYIPSIKPYLWYRFLEDNPDMENEIFCYIDSDVIFREMLDFSKFEKDDFWYGSNCNGYLNADYIRYTKNGQKTLERMCKIIGITEDQFEAINYDCIGAQMIIKKPKVEYWKKVYEDSNKLWKYFGLLDSNIQKWTAEMWSQLMNMPLFNIIPKVHEDFNFTWATDDQEKWFENKIYHNAGVVDSNSGLFFKGKYDDKSPFDDDLTHISKDKASYYYVRAINKVKDEVRSA